MKVTLENIPTLDAEITKVCQEYYNSVKSGNVKNREKLYQKICFSLDEIERYYLSQEHDERSILLKKQCLRLKKALQYTNTKQTNRNQFKRRNFVQVSIHDDDHVETKSGGENDENAETFKLNQKLIAKREKQKSRTKSEKNIQESKQEHQNTFSKVSLQDKYEATKTENQGTVKYARQIASESLHAAQNGRPAILGPNQSHIDFPVEDTSRHDNKNSFFTFRVHLSKEEYFEVMNRRRIIKEKQKHLERKERKDSMTNCKNLQKTTDVSKYITTKGGYQPNIRMITRDKEDRDKWVNKTDFKISSKRDFKFGKE